MKFSEQWLRSLLPVSLDSAALAHVLTMAGLEVEGVEPAAGVFSGVVVGEVRSLERHPKADRLNVCQVDVGEERLLQIVCGAPNAAVGIRVPCARVGAQLPGMAIAAAQLRGVGSEGMLCSATELGFGSDASGLLLLAADAPIGVDLREHLELDDQVLTLKLTPNRGDCLSLAGIARELAAITRVEAFAVPQPRIEVSIGDTVPVRSANHAACAFYRGRVLRGVDLRRPTPAWMVRRLERSAVRAINPVVDATNYVMLELGQPLHAFDLAALRGGILVRFARDGERLTLLNGQELELTSDLLVITDETGPIALAGLMGGLHSGVSGGTTDVFLESAYFSPQAVAGRMRRLGFNSDAGHRFERGVDFALSLRALDRLTEVIQSIAGGEAGPVTQDEGPAPVRAPIALDTARAARLLGIPVPVQEAAQMLGRLGFRLEVQGDRLLATAPTYRFDMEREEDLVEEIARLHGYENIPETLPAAGAGMVPDPERQRDRARTLDALVAREFQEVINYSFIDEGWEREVHGNGNPVQLANPIAAQMSVMRSSLLAGLLETLRSNLNRQRERVRVFELGCCFLRDGDGFQQPERLAALAYGPAAPLQWGGPERLVDFFDMKGDLEALLPAGRLRFEGVSHPALHPGRSAQVLLDGKALGVIGELHPRWQQHYELPKAPILFEVALEALQQRGLPSHREISRFPSVSRDLALIVPEAVSWRAIVEHIEACGIPHMASIGLFDLYRGPGVEAGRKSLAFRVLLQDTEKTFTDAEVDSACGLILQELEKSFGAKLRD